VLFSLLLFPFSIATLALFSIAFLQYTVCAAVNTPLQRRIIGPYEEKEQENLN
jgi:hypothetical protein